MTSFYERWQERPVILDAWFALQASAPFGTGVARVRALLQHPRFDPSAPNALRAVLGGFAGNAPQFHAADGAGYRFMAEQIVAVDQRNPITASRMAKVFSRWQSYGSERASQMHAALKMLAESAHSNNTKEVLQHMLDG